MHTNPFILTTLGTGAALPARGRFPTAQLLQIHGSFYLIDCGEGTQERLRQVGFNFQRIGHIFISHLHGDHYLGLMGLISSMHLMGRQAPLTVHGPADLRTVIDVQLRASGTWLRYPLEIRSHPVGSGQLIHQDEAVVVTSLELRHRLPCTGFVFREQPAQRPLRMDRLSQIPVARRAAVKSGDDLLLPDGTRLTNAELTADPPRPRSYAYCSDTAYEPALVPFVSGVDLLYHEATFGSALAARAKETLLSTAQEAAQLARDAGVGRLLLGHFSSRYKSADALVNEARTIFPNTGASEEGGRYTVGS